MRVFVTGASGYLGGAIADHLRGAGHAVLGLARSTATADALRRRDIEPVPGDLADGESLRRGAAQADGIVHCAFPRDAYERLEAAIDLDRSATHALVEAVRGTGKRLIYTSGAGVIGDTGGQPVTEDAPPRPSPRMLWRRELELAVLDADGVVIRPAFAYGRAGGDLLRALITDAIARGRACYAEPGTNPWPNVHVDDLAAAFAAALDRAAPGRVFNLAGGESTPREAIEAIGRLIGAPEKTAALPIAAALEVVPYVGWLQGHLRIDSTRARIELLWRPHGPELTHDIEHGSYRELIGERAASAHHAAHATGTEHALRWWNTK
jgi:nucleoside-diphosphate-sugar epimerase